MVRVRLHYECFAACEGGTLRREHATKKAVGECQVAVRDWTDDSEDVEKISPRSTPSLERTIKMGLHKARAETKMPSIASEWLVWRLEVNLPEEECQKDSILLGLPTDLQVHDYSFQSCRSFHFQACRWLTDNHRMSAARLTSHRVKRLSPLRFALLLVVSLDLDHSTSMPTPQESLDSQGE